MNIAYICLRASTITGMDAIRQRNYRNFALGQLDYMLGAHGRSFMVGYGTNYPDRPHHRKKAWNFNRIYDSLFNNHYQKKLTLTLTGLEITYADRWSVYRLFSFYLLCYDFFNFRTKRTLNKLVSLWDAP